MSHNSNFKKMQSAEVARLKEVIDRREAKAKALPKEAKRRKERLKDRIYTVKLRLAALKAKDSDA